MAKSTTYQAFDYLDAGTSKLVDRAARTQYKEMTTSLKELKLVDPDYVIRGVSPYYKGLVDNLKKVLVTKNLSKINYISQGDDYQILFSASKSKRRIIKRISKKLGVKITKIGKIQNNFLESSIIDQRKQVISLKNKGYLHKF